MKYAIALIACLFLISPSLAQQEDCNCSDVFDQMIEKLEANYIGLVHFKEMGKEKEYEDRKSDFSGRSKSTQLIGCSELMQEFLDYFEDGHLFVSERPEYTDVQKDSLVNYSRNLMSLNEINSALEDQLSRLNPESPDRIVGKYHDGDSEIGIIKNGNYYDAFILKTDKEGSLAGDLKARFKWNGFDYNINYHTYTGSSKFTGGGLYKENVLLKISGGITWVRLENGFERETQMVDWENGFKAPTFMKLDDESVLLSIPSWSLDYSMFSEFIKQHRSELENAKNLIFDIRGNTGGNAIYFPLFRLFADRDMPGGQGQVLSSEDNEAYFKRNLQFSKKIYQPVVDAIVNNPGEVVDGPSYPPRKYRQSKKSRVENVAILTDKACMSAAESFIIHTRRASSKIKVFGSPTRGVIDYTSVGAVWLTSCNQKVLFGYPTSTLNKDIPDNGYNKTGIVPDVSIPKSVKDKVAYIIDYYKK